MSCPKCGRRTAERPCPFCGFGSPRTADSAPLVNVPTPNQIADAVGGTAFMIVAVVQAILHYLGIAGVVLGLIAAIVGNRVRGWEMIVGGIGFFVLKYLIGFVLLGVVALLRRKE